MTNILLSTAGAMSLSERMSYGLQVFVVGLGTVFAVLVILWLALILFRVFAYDIPQNKAKKLAEAAAKVEVIPATEEPAPLEEAPEDDTQLIAVITAAIAAYNAQSGNALPFRVVSFKRATGANGWNSK